MLVSLTDFLKMRSDRGEKWPSRECIYQWKFFNFCGFVDSGAVRTFGTRKLLVDPIAFEEWLKKASAGGPNE